MISSTCLCANISALERSSISAPFIQMKRKGVRTERYLFTVSYKSDAEYGETMLFDIKSDPYQMHNIMLTAIPEEDLSVLCRELGTWLKRSNDPWYKKKLYGDLIIYPED